MLVYLLKSGACLGILFLFYTLFLEKENMHLFKRFYLLAALLLALIIPALVFTEYVEVPVTDYSAIQAAATTDEVIQITPALEADVLNIAPILWGIYCIGLLFFGIKFIRNLFQIFRRIRSNPKNKLARITQVLLQERIPPHTFFSYIFLNKQKLEANEIPKEVLLHEETHALQKHSWDVVFVEFLQVIFWVNPFIYLSKKAIKLNHEFLADQAVLKKDIDKTTYQNTLLSYLSADSAKKYQPTMANLITNSSYSSIKKRFTIMKTHTSRKSVLIKSLLLVPLLALLLYGFSETKIETISSQPSPANTSTINHEIIEEGTLTIRITKTGELFIEDQKVLSVAAESHIKELMKRNRILRAFILPDFEAPQQLIEDVNSMLEQYQLAQISIIGPEKPFSDQSSQHGATKTQMTTYNALAKKYNKQPKATRVIPLEDLEVLESVFRKMTEEQRRDTEPFPECDPIEDQEGATKKQIAEYNALAKKYNVMLSKEKSIQIKMKDVERLEYLHGLMTHEQKENAEPFPDFPEPPPPPKAPKAAKAPKVKKGEKSTIPPPAKAPKAPKVKKGEKSDIPPPPPAPNLEKQEHLTEQQEALIREREILVERQDVLTEEQESRMEEQEILMEEKESLMEEQDKLIEEQETTMREREAELAERAEEVERSIIEPPTPATPKSPLDHVIEMAKKDAIFYHEDNKISSDEAIAILKKNKSINIDTRGSNSNRPVVKLSTEPYHH